MLISREPSWRRNLRDYVLVVNEAVERAGLRDCFQASAKVLVADARAPKGVKRGVLVLKLMEGQRRDGGAQTMSRDADFLGLVIDAVVVNQLLHARPD